MSARLASTAVAHQMLADGAVSWGLPDPRSLVVSTRDMAALSLDYPRFTLFFEDQADFDAWVEKTDAGPLKHDGGYSPASWVDVDPFDIPIRLTFTGMHSSRATCTCGSCGLHGVVAIPFTGRAS